MANFKKPSIALVLSGGGIRAMIFHLGVLQFFAECHLLERVSKISTVSGGSLLIGLILQENHLQWPSSKTFCSVIVPNLKTKLCSSSLQWGAARQLKYFKNWQHIFSRANLLALALENEWKIKAKLSDIPNTPQWSINGTTAESGKRFRFKSSDFGDYTLGYAQSLDFPLSSALAMSAAFPGGFGPLKLNAQLFQWKKREWGDSLEQEKFVDIRYQYLHLYDGGIYDNLGLESFFDAGRGNSKLADDQIIVVSDAGAPLQDGFSFGILSPFRLKRIFDITSEQSRALRVRSFVNYIQQSDRRGAYLYINNPVNNDITTHDSAKFSANFPTTLRKLKIHEFDKLLEHGYRIAAQIKSQSNAW